MGQLLRRLGSDQLLLLPCNLRLLRHLLRFHYVRLGPRGLSVLLRNRSITVRLASEHWSSRVYRGRSLLRLLITWILP